MDAADFLSTRCIDLDAAMRDVASRPQEERLARLLRLAGCRFHGGHGDRLVSGASARLAAVGGLPVHALASAGLGPAEVARLARSTMGLAGAMSYLSLPGGTPDSAFGAVAVGHGHGSVAHVASVSVLVAGVTCAVENEFNGQRDLVHLARVTEARTRVQSRPPVVVPDPSLADAYAGALADADRRREAAGEALGSVAGTRSGLEMLNLLYPAGKATAFLLTGSLRGLQKVLAARHDPGREDEYRAVLGLVREPLAGLWPDLFPQGA